MFSFENKYIFCILSLYHDLHFPHISWINGYIKQLYQIYTINFSQSGTLRQIHQDSKILNWLKLDTASNLMNTVLL